MIEHFFTCPYCWERVSMLIDTDMENETYIEDCEVCCRPIEVNFTLRGDQINSFNYTAVQGNE